MSITQAEKQKQSNRTDIVAVTSENADKFYDDRMHEQGLLRNVGAEKPTTPATQASAEQKVVVTPSLADMRTYIVENTADGKTEEGKKALEAVIDSDVMALYDSLKRAEIEKKSDENKDEKDPDFEPESDETEPQKSKREKLNTRFRELTQEKKKLEAALAEKDAETAKEREFRINVERELEQLRIATAPPKPKLGLKPEPKNFHDADGNIDVVKYGEAIEKWSSDKTAIELTEREDARRQQELAQTRQRNWIDRQTEARKEIGDYDAAITASKAVVTTAVQEAILESERGPWILHHLAINPEAADKLTKMDDRAANREIGRLEIKLAPKAVVKIDDKDGKEKDEPSKKITIAEISKAPPPITPLSGAANPISDYSTPEGRANLSPDEYRKLRKAGKIR